MATELILVDEQDQQIGVEEKLLAHQRGLLHRALTVFIFNAKGELMLQKRASGKYHSGGLWTNTCCSHPSPGEETLTASHRRLKEEMGFDCELTEIFPYTYKVKFENGLTEHEYGHIFVGHYDEAPILNKDEAEDWRYVGLQELRTDVAKYPEKYTFWFRLIFEKVFAFQGLS